MALYIHPRIALDHVYISLVHVWFTFELIVPTIHSYHAQRILISEKLRRYKDDIELNMAMLFLKAV
jgi:hypothetical protein